MFSPMLVPAGWDAAQRQSAKWPLIGPQWGASVGCKGQSIHPFPRAEAVMLAIHTATGQPAAASLSGSGSVHLYRGCLIRHPPHHVRGDCWTREVGHRMYRLLKTLDPVPWAQKRAKVLAFMRCREKLSHQLVRATSIYVRRWALTIWVG